jgi:hypothetical protein
MKIQSLSIAALLAACASAPSPVPPVLDPGPGQREVLRLFASGVQVYECRQGTPSGPSNGFAAWAFVAPDARLFDARGQAAGSHGAGPYWRAADGSEVTGSVEARADADQAGAIPWLLLRTRSTGRSGAFERVSSIQRVHTEGGLAPADGCNAGSVGRFARIPYKAEYRLFSAA